MSRILIIMSVLGLLFPAALAEEPVVVEAHPGTGRPADVFVLAGSAWLPKDAAEATIFVYNLRDDLEQRGALDEVAEARLAYVARRLAPTATETERYVAEAIRVGARALAIATTDTSSPRANSCWYVCDNCMWEDFVDAIAEFCRTHGGVLSLSLDGDPDGDGKSDGASGRCNDGTRVRIPCCSSTPCPAG